MSEQVHGTLMSVIQEALAAAGDLRWISRCAVIFESVDTDGAKSMTFLPDDDMAGWDVMAFAAYLDEIGRGMVRAAMSRDDDDDEDE